ncbi:DHA2 family efflux MFS transporter permease subunit [Nocardia beijingensis]|uniref:DHA2 family efflux MFS transporter permease subunit n=1 Tax=Nocardia beijingensis TaxID=95162 RepID=UPI0018962CE6|nr:DHA2 family efflux MFS transporter permease subunit [Nocardia beijingensis]MBF6076438.1 DHA2 family efflux MFS transporter permease subunit [Nocardia beijingensis]
MTRTIPVTRPSMVPLATAGLMLGALLSVLDQAVVAIALPEIAADLGGMESIGWTVTAYLLATTVTGALYGRLSDRFGRRAVYFSAVGIFVIASALAGASHTLWQLVGARALQGIGGGALFVVPTIAIAELYPVDKRGRMQGLMGAVFAIASVGGPLIGGTITDLAGWRWIFYVNVPLGLAAMAVVALSLRLPRVGGDTRLDYPGAALLTAAVVSLLLVTEWGGRSADWGSPVILGLVALTLVALAVFRWWEPRTPHPILPLRLFADRTLRAALPATFVLGALLAASLVYLPTYLQTAFDIGATAAGLATLPYFLTFVAVAAIAGGRAGASRDFKPYLLTGAVLATAGFWLLSRLGPDTGYAVVALCLMVPGIAFGLMMQNLVVMTQNAVGPADLGVTTSATLALRGLGMSVGVAVLGNLLSRELTGQTNVAVAVPR